MGALDFFRQRPAIADAPPPAKKQRRGEPEAKTFGSTIMNNPHTGGFFRRYVGAVPNPNQVLTYETAKAGQGYKGSPIDLITEMIDKDPKIAGLLNSRVANVLQMDAAIRQYGDSEKAEMAARLIDRVGEEVGSWHQVQEEMLLRGIPYGLSVHEILWDTVSFPLAMGDRPRVKQWLIPIAFRQVAANRIGFDPEARLMIYARFQNPAEAEAAGYAKTDDENWWYPHPNAILTFMRYRDNENPYGRPLLAVLFYKAWFKRLMDKWWAQYNERNAEPMHVAEMGEEVRLSEEDETALQTIMQTIQQSTDAILPPGVTMKRLELGNGSASATFKAIIDNFDDQAAILITGQTSTSSSARQGSGAQSEVHERNALGIYNSDARALEPAMNRLFKLIVTMNDESLQYFCPKLSINARSADQTAKEAATMEKMVGLGLKIPCREAYRIIGIDEPIGSEACLEMQPANYSQAFGNKAPSQQTANKTAARADQRSRSNAPKSQAQPRKTR